MGSIEAPCVCCRHGPLISALIHTHTYTHTHAHTHTYTHNTRMLISTYKQHAHTDLTTQEDVPWAALKPLVFAAVMDHYSSGEPLIEDKEMQAHSDTAIHEDDDEVCVCVFVFVRVCVCACVCVCLAYSMQVVAMIKKLLETCTRLGLCKGLHTNICVKLTSCSSTQTEPFLWLAGGGDDQGVAGDPHQASCGGRWRGHYLQGV